MKHIVFIFLLLAASDASASWVSEKLHKAERWVTAKAEKAEGYVERHLTDPAKKTADATTTTATQAGNTLALVKWPLFLSSCFLAVWLACLAAQSLRKLSGKGGQSASP